MYKNVCLYLQMEWDDARCNIHYETEHIEIGSNPMLLHIMGTPAVSPKSNSPKPDLGFVFFYLGFGLWLNSVRRMWRPSALWLLRWRTQRMEGRRFASRYTKSHFTRAIFYKKKYKKFFIKKYLNFLKKF